MNPEPDPNDLQRMEGDELEGRGARQGGGLAGGGAATGAGVGTTGVFGSEGGKVQKADSGNAPTTAGYAPQMSH